MNPGEYGVALEAIELSKRYRGGAQALLNVSLHVAHPSFTALVGPNGAGKSTLIKTWVGFERPSTGGVRVCGVDPWRDRRAALRHLGYVPQQPTLYRALTVAEHLDFAAHIRPDFDIAAASSYLRRLDVPVRARPTTLSGGQQAQVMLALALGTSASVLLLDEPLASLDPLARGEFLAVLRSAVDERGATAMLSSHIVSDIEQVCDRLIILGVGTVLLDESLADVVATHEVWSTPVPHDAGIREVGQLAARSGELALVRVTDRSRVKATDGVGTRRQASVEEVVKGYLAAVRSTRRAVG